jgi:8-oxo-dGTP pyrophosphatase MutT (NUDIX family)
MNDLDVATGFVQRAAGPPSERRKILEFVAAHDDALHRSCVEGHLTGSALVVDPSRAAALLMHHRKLDKWLQMGGHADGDADLARVALREATEESGIDGLVIAGDGEPIDLDVHLVSPPNERPHLHLDVRFVVEAPPGADPVVNHESRAMRWVPLAELEQNAEPGMRRLARAARSLFPDVP